MKYWIFQSNQVLGPYVPEDLGRLPSFSAESLVCPEGRKGTSMGDWQRAGMVPDLSVALIKASSAHSIKTPVASLAGLPPEPTLKDLAVLGSLQEKMSMLEDVVLKLQDGLRIKDAELAELHAELTGKAQDSSATEMSRRETDVLKAETEEFKRRIAGLEERVSSVNRLAETIDKAVEAEKHVEHDVEVQGSTLAGLAQEIDSLRAQMGQRLDAASAPVVPIEPATPAAPAASVASEAPIASRESEMPAFPDIVAMPLKSTDTGLTELPMSATPALPPGMVSFDPLESSSSPAEPPPPAEAIVDSPTTPPRSPSRKKALVLGGVLGVGALAGLAFISGNVPGLSQRKPAAEIAAPPLTPAPIETPAPPVPDERQTAIDFAKQWSLKSGLTLGQSLETLSPANGNLSPWMAEPLSSGRVQVNYFARGSSPGAPTVAYEFEIDLAAKNVSGRNAAAKAVISEKAAPPPAPKKPKRIKVKAKPKPAAAPLPPTEESLDSLLGEPGAPPKPTPSPSPEAPATPSRPTHAKRAEKAAAKTAKGTESKAEDASLLDDLLKD